MLLMAGFIKSYEIPEMKLFEVLWRSQRAALEREGPRLNPGSNISQ